MFIDTNREKHLETNEISETEQSLSMPKIYRCVGK